MIDKEVNAFVYKKSYNFFDCSIPKNSILGYGVPAGKPFKDSTGREYVRDAKGTIRRVKTQK